MWKSVQTLVLQKRADLQNQVKRFGTNMLTIHFLSTMSLMIVFIFVFNFVTLAEGSWSSAWPLGFESRLVLGAGAGFSDCAF